MKDLELTKEFLLEVSKRREKKFNYTTKVLCCIAFLISIFIISFGGPILIAFLFLLL